MCGERMKRTSATILTFPNMDLRQPRSGFLRLGRSIRKTGQPPLDLRAPGPSSLLTEDVHWADDLSDELGWSEVPRQDATPDSSLDLVEGRRSEGARSGLRRQGDVERFLLWNPKLP
jgi:hypothetical protein